MIQKLKTKHDIRKEMEDEINRYLNQGGEITQIQRGLSGREDNTNLNQSIPLIQGEKQTRTLLNDTVKAIDERKQKKKPITTDTHRPKKRIIYDDFGEPIREVWE
ncbi:MAG: hypothetical protein ACRBCI_03230 [Cellvibrionaceae bacterium]